MSGILKAAVPIHLDGQDFMLRYRALAFIRYAEECNADLLEDLSQIGAMIASFGVSLEGVRAGTGGGVGVGLGVPLSKVVGVLWAGLVDAQPTLTRNDIARMVDFRSLEVIISAITKAIQLTMPEPAPDRPIETRGEPVSARVNGLESGPASETQAESQPMNS